MSATTNLLTLAAVLGLGAVAVVIAKAKMGAQSGRADGAPQFKAKKLLTPNELEFLARLELAAPELRFHAQVSMGALLDPAVSKKDDGKAFFRLRGRFSQKIVDFVAQNRADGAVVAIIELDDRMHDGEKDAKRDAMLASAGYRIVRWNSKTKPEAAAIRTELLPPPAPASKPVVS